MKYSVGFEEWGTTEDVMKSQQRLNDRIFSLLFFCHQLITVIYCFIRIVVIFSFSKLKKSVFLFHSNFIRNFLLADRVSVQQQKILIFYFINRENIFWMVFPYVQKRYVVRVFQLNISSASNQSRYALLTRNAQLSPAPSIHRWNCHTFDTENKDVNFSFGKLFSIHTVVFWDCCLF